MSGNRIRVRVHFSYDEFRPFYEGIARNVVARSLDGRWIRFPASSLRPFFTHEGISGVFELRFDNNHKLIELNRVS
jgi:hypothetical protein